MYHATKNPTGKIKYTVFFTEEDWSRIAWSRGNTRNINSYGFRPSDNRKDFTGFKNKFSRAIKDNPTLKLKYPKVFRKDMIKKKK